MARIAHRAVIAVAAFGELRIFSLRGIAVVAGHRPGERLCVKSQLLSKPGEGVRFVQVAGLDQRIVVNRRGPRKTEALAFHRQGIADQKTGGVFGLALHGAGEVVVGV